MSKTVDIYELVKRLRSEEWATVEREQTRNAAADALDAMAGEVATVRSARDMHHANYELMKAHNKELFGKLSDAETERDRLKAALEPFAKLSTDRERQDPPEGTMRVRVVTAPEIEAARKALGGDA